MQIMLREEAEKRNLFTRDPVTGKPIPFSSFRIEPSEDERAEQEKMVASGQIPF